MRRLVRFGLAAIVSAAAWPVYSQDPPSQAISGRLPEDYRALRERPLFSPDRRPPAPPIVEQTLPAEPAPPPPPEPVQVIAGPAWTLIGVVRSDKVQSALFTAQGEPEPFSIRMGESRDNWTLHSLGRFDVVLRNGDNQANIRFPDNDSPTGSPAAFSDGNPPAPRDMSKEQTVRMPKK